MLGLVVARWEVVWFWVFVPVVVVLTLLWLVTLTVPDAHAGGTIFARATWRAKLRWLAVWLLVGVIAYVTMYFMAAVNR